MVEAGIRRVQDELALWRAAGQKQTFWIRDDDATCVTEQLERLLSIATRYDVSVGLALIPGSLQADLVDFLRTQSRNFHPMCHGWKHVDYGDAGNPNEFGNSRSHSATCQDATLALQAFRAHFAGTEAVFVPPFNRITPAMIGALADIGYAGLSVGPRPLERRIARVVNRFGLDTEPEHRLEGSAAAHRCPRRSDRLAVGIGSGDGRRRASDGWAAAPAAQGLPAGRCAAEMVC